MATVGEATIKIVGDASSFLKALTSAVAKAGAVAGAVGAAVPPMAALAATAAQVAPAIALIAPAAVGAAAAIATLTIGLQGVGTAFSAVKKASDSAMTDAAAKQKAVAAAAKQVEAAQRGVEQAMRGVAQAERALADAQKDARSAQEDLNRARRDAREELEDLQLTLKGAALSEKDAQLSLKEAQLAYQNLDPNASALERERAALRVAQAEQRLAETTERNGDLAEEAAEKQKKGVEGSDQVVAAKERVVAANERVKDAEQGVADAHRAVADAQRNLADAQQAMADAANQVSAAMAAQQKALDDLAPSARDFVLAMVELGDEWKDLRLAVQQNLFKDLDETITRLAEQQLPTLKAGLSGIATELNRGFADSMKVFSTDQAVADFNTTLTNLTGGFGELADASKYFTQIFIDITTVASEFLDGEGNGLENWAKRTAESIREMRESGELAEKIAAALTAIKNVFTALADVGGIVAGVFRAAQEATEGTVGPIGIVLDKLHEAVDSDVGQATLVEFFRAINEAVLALAPILGDIAVIIGQTVVPAMSDFIVNAAPGLRDAVQGIGDVFAILAPLLTPLGELVSWLGSLFQGFLDAAGPGLTEFVNSMLRVSESFGPFTSVAPQVEELVAALGAAFGAVAELLGGVFEVLAPVAAGLIDALAPAVTMVLNVFTFLVGVLAEVVSWIGDKLGPVIQIVTTLVASLGVGLGSIIGVIAGVVAVVIGAVKAWQFLMKVIAAVKLVWTALSLAFSVSPIGVLVIAITALVAGLTWFFTQTETGKKIWDAFTGALVAGWEWVKGAFSAAWEKMEPIFDGIGAAFTWLWENGAKPAIDGLTAAFTFLWDYVLSPIFTGIKIALAVVLTAFLLWWEGVKVVLDLWWQLFQWIWDTVLQPIWEGIKVGFQLVGEVFLWVWENLIKPAWDGLGAGLQWVWDTIISPLWEGMKFGLQLLGDFFVWVWNSLIKPAWDALGMGISWVWENIIRPAWDALKAALQAVGDFFGWIWNSIIKPVWDALGAGISWVWDNVVSPVFDAMKTGVELVGVAFEKASDWIGKMWDRIKGFAAKPVKWVIENVYNEGVVPAWNTVAGWLGLEKLDPFTPEAIKAAGYARGGVLPGYTPGQDVHEFWSRDGKMKIGLSGGEAIMRPEVTRVLGTAGVDSLNAAAVVGGEKAVSKELARMAFAGGGVVENLWGIVEREFPGQMTLTSSYRDTADLHGQGKAIDVSNGGNEGSPEMKNVARYFYKTYGSQLAELIHWPLDGWQNVDEGVNFDFGSATNEQHRNHVHIAAHAPLDDTRLGAPTGSGGGVGRALRSIVAEAWDAIMDPIGDMIPDFGDSMIAKLPKAYFDKFQTTVRDWILGEADKKGPVSGYVGGGAEQWRSTVEQVFANQSRPADWMDETLAQIQSESGGNPTAINDWDSNAAAGTPSKGLLQVIDPTFAAYRDPDYPNDIWDPHANIAAALNYVVARYGSPVGVWGQGHGYDAGGIMKNGEWGYNTSGKPERVLTGAQTEAFDAFVAWLTGKGDQQTMITKVGDAIGEAAAPYIAKACEKGTKQGTKDAAGAGGGAGGGFWQAFFGGGNSSETAKAIEAAMTPTMETVTEGLLTHTDTLYDDRTTGLTDAELEQKKKEQWEAIFGEGSADNISFADVNGRNAITWNGQVGHDMGNKAGDMYNNGTAGNGGTVTQQGNTTTTTIHAPVTYQGEADFETLLRDFGSRLLALLDH